MVFYPTPGDLVKAHTLFIDHVQYARPCELRDCRRAVVRCSRLLVKFVRRHDDVYGNAVLGE